MSEEKPLPVLPSSSTAERWVYVGRRLRSGKTWIWTVSFMLAAFVIGAAFIEPVLGLLFAGGVLVLGLLIVYFRASSAAENDFYEAYAAHRGLQHFPGRGSLPPATPLLRKGDHRHTDRQLTGPLPGDLNGTLAQYTYAVETRGSKGQKQTTYYHFTVVFTPILDFAGFINEFHCEMRAGFRFLDGLEDAFRTRNGWRPKANRSTSGSSFSSVPTTT